MLGLIFLIALYMNILLASNISSIASLYSFRVESLSYANMTALLAKIILVLIKSSDTNGFPLINLIFGNLLIKSHISVGFSGANITIYYIFFKYLARNGNMK